MKYFEVTFNETLNTLTVVKTDSSYLGKYTFYDGNVDPPQRGQYIRTKAENEQQAKVKLIDFLIKEKEKERNKIQKSINKLIRFRKKSKI